MDIHVCKQCGAQFVYCRMCAFRPVRYKEKGFCSKECYEASKNNIVELKVVDEVAVVDEPKQVEEIIKDVQIVDEKVEAEAVATEETSIETATVDEPTIKNETNTYKKKKNKYKVHE